MNHAKIAAALHALAEAFEGAVEEIKDVATGKGKKTKVAEQPALAAAPAAANSTATAASQAAPAPAVPTITLKDVNTLVLKVAAKNRDGAVSLLGRLGLASTVGLPPERFQAVYDAFEEEIAKIDAAAVQVAQASLV